jgi:hypothetical protein
MATGISVSKQLQLLLCGIALCGSAAAIAEEEEVPDMEFLEYLGMWEESDEDWLLLDEDTVAENDERSDPVPDGEESTETEDES